MQRLGSTGLVYKGYIRISHSLRLVIHSLIFFIFGTRVIDHEDRDEL